MTFPFRFRGILVSLRPRTASQSSSHRSPSAWRAQIYAVTIRRADGCPWSADNINLIRSCFLGAGAEWVIENEVVPVVQA